MLCAGRSRKRAVTVRAFVLHASDTGRMTTNHRVASRLTRFRPQDVPSFFFLYVYVIIV